MSDVRTEKAVSKTRVGGAFYFLRRLWCYAWHNENWNPTRDASGTQTRTCGTCGSVWYD
jgi:hypothetical protein